MRDGLKLYRTLGPLNEQGRDVILFTMTYTELADCLTCAWGEDEPDSHIREYVAEKLRALDEGGVKQTAKGFVVEEK